MKASNLKITSTT